MRDGWLTGGVVLPACGDGSADRAGKVACDHVVGAGVAAVGAIIFHHVFRRARRSRPTMAFKFKLVFIFSASRRLMLGGMHAKQNIYRTVSLR